MDEYTYLVNQHWVVVDEISKSKVIYIFRSNHELLVSQNGKVVKGKWEYIGNNSLLIDREGESFLFKQGFMDENVLVLKVDGKNEYAFLANENRYDGDLNTVEKISAFLETSYTLEVPSKPPALVSDIQKDYSFERIKVATNKGIVEILAKNPEGIWKYGDDVLLKDEPAPDGDYIYGEPIWISVLTMCCFTVKDGKLMRYQLKGHQKVTIALVFIAWVLAIIAISRILS